MRVAAAIVPAAVPQMLGEDAEAGAFAMAYLPPDRYPRLEAAARPTAPAPTRWPRRSATCWAASMRRPPTGRDSPRAFRPTRSSTRSASSRTSSPPPRAHADLAERLLALVATTAEHEARAGPRRLQPEEHSDRPRRTGHSRCRMRVVRRSGVRPRVRAQPPAAEGRVAAAMARRTTLRCSTALRDAYRAHVAWEPWPALEARTAALLPGLLLARIDGKSPVEYLTDEDARDAVAPVRTQESLAARAYSGTACAFVRAMTPTTINRVHARRVWDSRGRPTVEAEVRLASGVDRTRHRARRRVARLARGGRSARRRHPLGGFDVAQAVANVHGPIARAIFGMDALDQARHRRHADRARRHAEQGAYWAATPRWPFRSPSRKPARWRTTCRCGSTWPATSRCRCRCPRSRSSAAARMPAGASTSRT